jgi:hypothetical protein
MLGDYTQTPLVVASSLEFALRKQKIKSRCMYGHAAWIALLGDDHPVWIGSWKTATHFWVHTQFGEIVDLCLSNQPASSKGTPATAICAPLLWSNEIPCFYHYEPIGIAQIELPEPKEQQIYAAITAGIESNLTDLQEKTQVDAQDFPAAPMLCSQRQLLDDQNQSFARFDRALRIKGIPQLPQFFEKPDQNSQPCH